jgi:hypothetical protein
LKRIIVASSSLLSIGHDPSTNVLEVRFRNGRCYQYFAVPRETFEHLMAAESKGAYLNAHIKDRFPMTRVP